jgi:hypothetical protein
MKRADKIAVLSPRARKLWDRLVAGEFYPTFDANTPKAMDELDKAGLVHHAMRPQTYIRCFVPVGYKPTREERFPA